MSYELNYLAMRAVVNQRGKHHALPATHAPAAVEDPTLNGVPLDA